MSLTQAMYAASVGAFTNQQKLDVLANNLANINTPGFKQDKLLFRVPVGSEKVGNSQTEYLQGPLAAMARSSWTDFSQGGLRHTGNPLDLALNGKGFFCVETPGGTRYTRDGSFAINEDGVLATRDGHPVLGKGGEIRIDGRNVSVDEVGNVSVDGNEVGTLKVVSVPQPASLKKMGNALFASPGGDEMEAQGFKVMEGYIESSNVNGVKAMTEMIEISRFYESYQKTIQFLNDATKKSISEVGRLA